jgi:ElaB/YqjD/DUF883 family membrane-anchored ribosome-binding protein
MGQDASSGRSPVTEDTDQIQRDIEQTRQELGDTVEALAAKTDVKAQAKRKVDDTKASVSAKKDEVLGKARDVSPETATQVVSQVGEKAAQNPIPMAALGAFAAGFLVGRLSRRT